MKKFVGLVKLISFLGEKTTFTFMVDWKPIIDFLQETRKKLHFDLWTGDWEKTG